VGVEPAMFGQERRVDVDDPPAPLAHEPGRKDAHEAGERDRPDAMIAEGAAERPVETLLADAFAVPRPGRKPARAGPVEAFRVRLVRGDQDDLVAARLLDQSAHVAAA